jgi:hypothetical protein
MERRFVVEAKEFLFFGEVGLFGPAFGGKKEVFFRGVGFGLAVFRLVGGHGEGGAEVTG